MSGEGLIAARRAELPEAAFDDEMPGSIDFREGVEQGRAQERADVLAHISRRHANALARASRDYGGEDEARLIARNTAVLHGNIAAGIHEGDGEIGVCELHAPADASASLASAPVGAAGSRRSASGSASQRGPDGPDSAFKLELLTIEEARAQMGYPQDDTMPDYSGPPVWLALGILALIALAVGAALVAVFG